MNPRSQFLSAFNAHFVEFISDIRRVFPEDVEIATAEEALERMRKANPRLIITVFHSYITAKYMETIMAGDIDFFINKDYSEDLRDATDGEEKRNLILSKIDALRAPIKHMNSDEQSKVIKYLQNLCKLSMMYHS